MKIYTKTGDKGETGLWGGKRVPKDHSRIQAYGTVDECNATLGLARSVLAYPELDQLLAQVQNQLFVVGADLASEGESQQIPRVQPEDSQFLEQAIDGLEAELPALTQFILPGGTQAASYLHLARTVCRRAERWTVSLQAETAINPQITVYLNRLSDFLFVAARAANHRAQQPDTPWQKPVTPSNSP